MANELHIQALTERVTGLNSWLELEAAERIKGDRHLDQDSVESAYWHAGYKQALADALNMLSAPAARPGT